VSSGGTFRSEIRERSQIMAIPKKPYYVVFVDGSFAHDREGRLAMTKTKAEKCFDSHQALGHKVLLVREIKKSAGGGLK
jgi:hypothetical protein